MTISVNDRIVVIQATPGQTILDTDYRVDLKEYVSVVRRRAGATVLLLLDVDYTVSNLGNDNGCRITLTTGAQGNDVYSLAGGLPVGRSSSFVQAGGVSAALLDAELDRFQQQLQEMRRDVNAAIRVDPTLGLTPTLPDPVGGRFLGWSDDGLRLENRNGSAPVHRGDWLPVLEYAALDIVRRNGSSYLCTSGHQSTFDTEPGAGPHWESVWELIAEKGQPGLPGLPGPGSGDLLAANNLSELANKGTARSNLGLGALATLNTVDTGQLNNDAVVYAKIQNVSATDRLLGRVSPGSGDIEEVPFTDYAQAFVSLVNEAAVKAYLNLEIGIDVQAWSAVLDVWATKTPPAGVVVGTTDAQTLTNKAINGDTNTITNLTLAMFSLNVADTDVTLAANSNLRVATQAAVKSYVDNLITGAKWKQAVACKTTGNIALAGEQTIDGVITSGSRVLVASQTDPTQNGLWISAAGAWSRAADADTGGELVAAAVLVTQGTLYQNTTWANSNSAITLGVTAIGFAQMSGAGTYSAAGGLALAGNQFSVAAHGVTFAKMQTVATDSLLGRDTAGTGDVESILLNATLEMDGAGNLRRAALSGDVVAAAGANATTISNDAVTFAKMQNIATDSLIGRDSAGTGDPENITLNLTLEMTGGGVLRRAALTGDVVAAAGDNATTISPNAVTFSKLQQIGTLKLIGRQTAAVGNAEEIGVGGGIEFNGASALQVMAFTGDVAKAAGGTTLTIGADKVLDTMLRNSAALSVIGRSANSSGDPADIAAANDGEVLRRNGAALGFGTIVTAGIANDAVTFAKLQNVAQGAFLGRVTADSGDVEELTMTPYFYGLAALVASANLRSYAGLVIGTDVQAFSQKLDDIAGASWTDGQVPVWNQTTGHFEPGSGAGGGAPTNVAYLVETSSGSLSAERVVTDTVSVKVDWTTPGQAKFNAVDWACQPIGAPIPIYASLFASLSAALPPTNQGYRYILLTAGEDGVGEYNESVLTSESVSGSAPLVQATAVISLAGSPLNGKTVRLINTERRFLRAGTAGVVEDDQMQTIGGQLTNIISTSGMTKSGVFNGSSRGSAQSWIGTQSSFANTVIDFDSASSSGARAGTETRSKNIGATYVMRIL